MRWASGFHHRRRSAFLRNGGLAVMTPDHRQTRSVAGDSPTEMVEILRRIVRALARADAEEEHKRQMGERDRGHDHSG
jgi:hypothetical protein